MHLLEYVHQRWGERHTVIHAEAQSVSLSDAMIWILSENHHLYLIKRSSVKSRKNLPTRRKNLTTGIFLPNKIGQLLEIRCFPLSGKHTVPRRLDAYVHILVCLL